MNSQQKQFCDEYLLDLNATQAAIRAGYSEKTARSQASVLLDNEELIEYISAKQKRISQKLDWSFEKVLLRFAEISDRCMQAEQVVDNEGNPTGEWKFDANAAIKSTENIGKHIGFYEKDNNQKAPAIISKKITFK